MGISLLPSMFWGALLCLMLHWSRRLPQGQYAIDRRILKAQYGRHMLELRLISSNISHNQE